MWNLTTELLYLFLPVRYTWRLPLAILCMAVLRTGVLEACLNQPCSTWWSIGDLLSCNTFWVASWCRYRQAIRISVGTVSITGSGWAEWRERLSGTSRMEIFPSYYRPLFKMWLRSSKCPWCVEKLDGGLIVMFRSLDTGGKWSMRGRT